MSPRRLDPIESPHDTLEVGCNHLAVEAGEGSQREGLRGHQCTPEARPVRTQRVRGASDMDGSYREPGQGRSVFLPRLPEPAEDPILRLSIRRHLPRLRVYYEASEGSPPLVMVRVEALGSVGTGTSRRGTRIARRSETSPSIAYGG